MKSKITKNKPKDISHGFIDVIRNLIIESRSQVGTFVNFALTTLYWRIGQRILSEKLKYKRADYGSQIVATLS